MFKLIPVLLLLITVIPISHETAHDVNQIKWDAYRVISNDGRMYLVNRKDTFNYQFRIGDVVKIRRYSSAYIIDLKQGHILGVVTHVY